MKDWRSDAKHEWHLVDVHLVDEPETCLCNHFPIIEICTIGNSRNGNLARIGNHCVKKFLGLPSNIIFQAIKRVRKDVKKSLNEETLVHYFEKGIINEWEKKFYLGAMNKRLLTDKQWNKKVEINTKIIRKISS